MLPRLQNYGVRASIIWESADIWHPLPTPGENREPTVLQTGCEGSMAAALPVHAQSGASSPAPRQFESPRGLGDALCKAAEGGASRKLRRLLEGQPAELVDARDDCGLTPFHTAVLHGQLATAKLLANLGANKALMWQPGDLNLQDNRDMSEEQLDRTKCRLNNLGSWTLTARSGDLAVVGAWALTSRAATLPSDLLLRALLDAGFPTACPPEFVVAGDTLPTAFLAAARYGRLDNLRLLLQHGCADVGRTTLEGENAAHLAAKCSEPDIHTLQLTKLMRAIIDAGVDYTAKDNKGLTPLWPTKLEDCDYTGLEMQLRFLRKHEGAFGSGSARHSSGFLTACLLDASGRAASLILKLVEPLRPFLMQNLPKCDATPLCVAMDAENVPALRLVLQAMKQCEPPVPPDARLLCRPGEDPEPFRFMGPRLGPMLEELLDAGMDLFGLRDENGLDLLSACVLGGNLRAVKEGVPIAMT
ncbi:hypothetical protein WJX72_010437 [[Myrmecia] bisecta]|uniref:Uncharacterized protein n=1 Tax=[Myrmecia] bisecta TaxID=41462 RepID=A0AAW1R9B0_9CHLO